MIDKTPHLGCFFVLYAPNRRFESDFWACESWKMACTNRIFGLFWIKTEKSMNFFRTIKIPEIRHFSYCGMVWADFFKINFEKTLDFFDVWTHTVRALSWERKKRKLSTPKIQAVYGTTKRMGILINTQTLWIKAAHQNSRRDVQTVEFGNIQTLTKSNVHILDR